LASSALRSLVAASPQWLSAVTHLDIDARVLAVSTGMVILTAVVCGVVPALQVSNTDLAKSLRESARATGLRARRRIQNGLVVAQVALTLVLLVGAGLLIKSFWHLQRADLGLESRGVLLFDTRLPANKYFRQVGVRNGFTLLDVSPVPAVLFDRVVTRLSQVPGLQSVAGLNIAPLNGGGLGAPFTVEGRPTTDAAGARENLSANYYLTTPNFF